MNEIPLADEEDIEVLIHRETHFGGQFPIMVEYYEKERKGAVLDEERVYHLAGIEKQIGEDLALGVLAPQHMEQVLKAQEAYKQLRAVYEVEKPVSDIPGLIADLVLSEGEEEEAAIEAIIEQGERLIPELIKLVCSETFAESYFPGYGFAPALAAKVLGKVGDERAIVPLFESLNSDNEELSWEAQDGLLKLGEPARQFLLKVLRGHPITQDTEDAASMLSLFPASEEVALAAANLLEEEGVRDRKELATYLALCTETDR